VVIRPAERAAAAQVDIDGAAGRPGLGRVRGPRPATPRRRVGGGRVDEAMIAALRAEDVLCADETPVNVVNNIEPGGEPADGSPHVVTIRTPDARLVWYKAIAARTAKKIAQLGVFTAWYGILVRDDYAGWHQFDAQLAGSSNAVLT
jgi:transposase